MLWEMEKLLVMSSFSFSHTDFKRLVLQTHENQGLFGKELNQKMCLFQIKKKKKNWKKKKDQECSQGFVEEYKNAYIYDSLSQCCLKPF